VHLPLNDCWAVVVSAAFSNQITRTVLCHCECVTIMPVNSLFSESIHFYALSSGRFTLDSISRLFINLALFQSLRTYTSLINRRSMPIAYILHEERYHCLCICYLRHFADCSSYRDIICFASSFLRLFFGSLSRVSYNLPVSSAFAHFS